MGELWFAFKAMSITIVMIFLMQIKFGENTIEENAYTWIKSSYLTVYLDEVSRGSVIALRETFKELTSLMGNKVRGQFQSEFSPGNRKLLPSLERSKAYIDEIKEQVKDVDVKEVAENIKKYQQQLKEAESLLDDKRKPAQESESW